MTPRLELELPGGSVRIANGDYHLGSTPVSWQESTPVSWQESAVLTWNSATGEGTKRYRGLERGGTVVSDADGATIAADLVASGTRADYLAAARRSTTIFTALGGGLGVVGGLILAGSGWRLARLRRGERA